MAKQKVCLAYSGGLDTSCILRYLLVSRDLLLYGQLHDCSKSFETECGGAVSKTALGSPPGLAVSNGVRISIATAFCVHRLWSILSTDVLSPTTGCD